LDVSLISTRFFVLFRIRNKEKDHEAKRNDEGLHSPEEQKQHQEEKELLDQMTAIEKAYEIMKSSFNGGLSRVKGSGREGGETRDSLAKLISMI
jgi:hypothetical protein